MKRIGPKQYRINYITREIQGLNTKDLTHIYHTIILIKAGTSIKRVSNLKTLKNQAQTHTNITTR